MENKLFAFIQFQNDSLITWKPAPVLYCSEQSPAGPVSWLFFPKAKFPSTAYVINIFSFNLFQQNASVLLF